MTPTLRGRRQTRIVVTLLIGIPVTLPFCLIALLTSPLSAPLPYLMLGVVLAIGLWLDGWYHQIQQRRWDHDWPTYIQVAAGVFEFFLSYIACFGCCGGFALLNPGFLLIFPVHYLCIWLPSFLFLQGPVQLLSLRWRFYGGEWSV